MQVTSEHSDNFNLNDNVKRTEGPAANNIIQTTAHKTDVETAKAVLTAQENVVKSLDSIASYVSDTRTEIFDKSSSDAFYLIELRKSVDSFAKAQYALVTLHCFVCLCLFALVIVLSLAFL